SRRNPHRRGGRGGRSAVLLAGAEPAWPAGGDRGIGRWRRGGEGGGGARPGPGPPRRRGDPGGEGGRGRGRRPGGGGGGGAAEAGESRPAPWRIAIGRSYPGPSGVVRSYDEAEETLDVAQRLGLADPVVSAGDLLIYHVLLRDRAAITDLVRTLLTPLARA